MSDTSMLAFPKPKDVKRKKHHPKSIMHQKDGTCYLCQKLYGDSQYHTTLEEHHAFPASNRRISEEYGLKVYLCPMHHQNSPEAVHSNYELQRMIKADAQEAFEQDHSHAEWMQLIGKNYL